METKNCATKDHCHKIHGPAARVRQWAVRVDAVYCLAQQRLMQVPMLTDGQRQAFYARVVERVVGLGQQYAQEKGHACRALAQRLLRRHQGELFQFVLIEAVRAENNLAERSLNTHPMPVIGDHGVKEVG
jgi:hypothetical protein